MWRIAVNVKMLGKFIGPVLIKPCQQTRQWGGVYSRSHRMQFWLPLGHTPWVCLMHMMWRREPWAGSQLRLFACWNPFCYNPTYRSSFHLSERATLHNKLHWCNQIFPQIKLGLIGCPQDCFPPSQQSWPPHHCPSYPLCQKQPLKSSLSHTNRGGLHPAGRTGDMVGTWHEFPRCLFSAIS